MDEINKMAQRAMEETARSLASQTGRSIAGGLFTNTMQNISLAPSIGDHLRAMFSSGGSISNLAQEIEVWKKDAPENKHLVVMLRTPNGDIMDVEQIRPNAGNYSLLKVLSKECLAR